MATNDGTDTVIDGVTPADANFMNNEVRPGLCHLLPTVAGVLPANLYVGMRVLETTKNRRIMWWTGSAWQCEPGQTVICTNLAARPVPSECTIGLQAYQTDTGEFLQFDGTQWRATVGLGPLVPYAGTVNNESPGFVLGNGQIQFRWRMVAPKRVQVDLVFLGGTTTVWGPAGRMVFGLPITGAPVLGAWSDPIQGSYNTGGSYAVAATGTVIAGTLFVARAENGGAIPVNTFATGNGVNNGRAHMWGEYTIP